MSNVSRKSWEERVGLGQMKEIPPAHDSERRVGMGRTESARALRTRDHAAIVYWSPSELLDSVVPYLEEGLRAGDKVVYVADENPVNVIAEALRARGCDVERATREGRLMLVTARDAFFPNGRFDVEAALRGVQELAAAAERDGFPRVRFSVEMTYLLADVPGIEHGPEFESRANDEVFKKFPFVCICSFNGNRGTSEVLDDVLATHPILLSNGIPLANPHYRPWKELQQKSRAAAGAGASESREHG